LRGRAHFAEGRGQRAEGRGQRAEGRGQRAEGRGQREKTESTLDGQGRNDHGFQVLFLLYALCPMLNAKLQIDYNNMCN
jgi:hypothetical protein